MFCEPLRTPVGGVAGALRDVSATALASAVIVALLGDIRAVLPPMTFHDVELPMGPMPALGQHNHAILAELGLLDEDAPASKEPSDA